MTTQFALPVEVVRTKRKKTASIEIKDGLIRVLVPNSLTDKRVDTLLEQRASWINKKIRLQAEMPPYRSKEYVNGETFTYLGRNYRLKLVNTDTTTTRLKNGYLEVPAQGERGIQASLTDWYTSHALAKLEEKTGRYAKTLNVEPSSVTVKDYKSRWGSCSTSGDITYNWRIIMAPHRIVDYVVIHELCHLVEHNHSDKYWKQVESLVPDYRERRAWLKTNANTLAI